MAIEERLPKVDTPQERLELLRKATSAPLLDVSRTDMSRWCLLVRPATLSQSRICEWDELNNLVGAFNPFPRVVRAGSGVDTVATGLDASVKCSAIRVDQLVSLLTPPFWPCSIVQSSQFGLHTTWTPILKVCVCLVFVSVLCLFLCESSPVQLSSPVVHSIALHSCPVLSCFVGSIFRKSIGAQVSKK